MEMEGKNSITVDGRSRDSVFSPLVPKDEDRRLVCLYLVSGSV